MLRNVLFVRKFVEKAHESSFPLGNEIQVAQLYFAVPMERAQPVFRLGLELKGHRQRWIYRCVHERSLPPMFASPRRSSCARMCTNIRPWRFGNFVWILGKKHCALKFENKQRFGTCPNSFFGGKKCKTSSLWFRIQWVQISGVLHIRIRG